MAADVAGAETVPGRVPLSPPLDFSLQTDWVQAVALQQPWREHGQALAKSSSHGPRSIPRSRSRAMHAGGTILVTEVDSLSGFHCAQRLHVKVRPTSELRQ